MVDTEVGTQDLVVVLEDAEEEVVQRSEEHTSELQSPCNIVCRLLLEKKKDPDHSATAHITDASVMIERGCA